MHRVQCTILNEIKKGDLFLLALFLFAAAGIVLTSLLPSGDNDGTAFVEIRVDGEEWGRYPLSEDQVISVSTVHGDNEITIRDGAVCISKADCSNRICVQTGTISAPGQTIVCLPHRLSVEITADRTDQDQASSHNNESYDAIAQ